MADGKRTDHSSTVVGVFFSRLLLPRRKRWSEPTVGRRQHTHNATLSSVCRDKGVGRVATRGRVISKVNVHRYELMYR